MEKRTKSCKLTPREMDILYAIWKAERPLMASEIAGEELKLATVHATLKRLLKKNMVEIVEFAKSGNVYGRCYQPTMSMMEFELRKFADDYKNITCGEITVANLIEEYLDDLDEETLLEELDGLEQYIKERRKEIRQAEPAKKH